MHLLLLVMSVAVAAPGPPAAFSEGTLPAQPTQFVGGGEVLLEVAVAASGAVNEIRTLRATAPYTDLGTQLSFQGGRLGGGSQVALSAGRRAVARLPRFRLPPAALRRATHLGLLEVVGL